MRVARPNRVRRWLLGGAAVAALGLTTGCQTAGTQFANPGIARGDYPAAVGGNHVAPSSPAFAQVAAGQHLPVGHSMAMGGRPMPGPQPTMMAGAQSTIVLPNGQIAMIVPTGQMASGMPAVSNQPLVGSGGMVYPVSYVPHGAGGFAAANPATAVPNGPGMIVPSPSPAGPHGMVTTPVAGTVLPGAPTDMELPRPGTVIESQGRMIGATPEAVPAAPASATFTVPPPPTLPPLALPDVRPAPEALPNGVTGKPPTGPSLPTTAPASPSLGAFPATPVPSVPPAGPKLPPVSKFVDDDIPTAPAFVPAPAK